MSKDKKVNDRHIISDSHCEAHCVVIVRGMGCGNLPYFSDVRCKEMATSQQTHEANALLLAMTP